MTISRHNFTPFVPGDGALERSGLPDLAVTLARADANLGGHWLSAATRETIRQYMAVINSYYSNLIEGNNTRPHEIRAAQRGKYSRDPAKRDLQRESLAHIYVQNWIKDQAPDQDTIFSPAFLRAIHREFYLQLPEHMREVRDEEGKAPGKVTPGGWRTRAVKVGQHIPPPHKELASLMDQFCDTYHPGKYTGDRKYIALMCAHHRLLWLHPFLDGNGRVARLFTDTALASLGLNSVGVWCLSRGLARTSTQYRESLARADFPRQGAQDGRGMLSENQLVAFCEYMFRTAIDQVEYISGLLALNKMRNRIHSYIKARNDDRVAGIHAGINEVAAAVLYQAFIEGELQRSTAIELCRMPERSARRVLKQLREEGLLTETSTKSPLRWAIPEHAEPWYFPEIVPERG